jgi:ribosome-interacting GTPase 1
MRERYMIHNQTENDDVAPIVMGNIVYINAYKHAKKIKEIRDLLIILNEYQYKNDAVIVETALEIGLNEYEKRLSHERDLISPF